MPSRLRCAAGLLALLAPPLAAQQPDSAARARPEIRWDLTADGVADLSPSNPTRPDSARFALRSLELAAQARVTTRSLLAAVVSLTGNGQVQVDEARLSADLPFRSVLTGGRFQLPLGDWAGAHREANPMVDRPLATQRFVATEVLSGSGLRLGVSLGPVLVQGAVVDRIREPAPGLVTIERPNRLFSGLGYVARIEAVRGRQGSALGILQLSASGATSRLAQPLSAFAPQDSRRVNAVLARQSVFTAGARWTSGSDLVSLRAEFLSQVNESESSIDRRIPADIVNGGPYYRGPVGSYNGGYAMAIVRALDAVDVVGKAESVQDPELNGRNRRVIGGGLQWHADPRMLIRGAYEFRAATGLHEQRILLEGVATTGAHLLGLTR